MLIVAGMAVINMENLIGAHLEQKQDKSCDIIFCCVFNRQYTLNCKDEKSAIETVKEILESYKAKEDVCYCNS